MKSTKEAKLLKFLKTGKEISRQQVISRFKLLNPSSAISSIEKLQYNVVRTYVQRKSDGFRIVKYSIAK